MFITPSDLGSSARTGFKLKAPISEKRNKCTRCYKRNHDDQDNWRQRELKRIYGQPFWQRQPPDADNRRHLPEDNSERNASKSTSFYTRSGQQYRTSLDKTRISSGRTPHNDRPQTYDYKGFPLVSSKLPWKRRADEDAEEYLAKSTNVYKTRRARYLTAKPIGETPAETVKKATNKEKWILGEELRGHSEIGRPDRKPDKEETHRERATEIISLFDDGYITEAEMLSRANGLLEEVGIWEDTIKEDNETKGAKKTTKRRQLEGLTQYSQEG